MHVRRHAVENRAKIDFAGAARTRIALNHSIATIWLTLDCLRNGQIDLAIVNVESADELNVFRLVAPNEVSHKTGGIGLLVRTCRTVFPHALHKCTGTISQSNNGNFDCHDIFYQKIKLILKIQNSLILRNFCIASFPLQVCCTTFLHSYFFFHGRTHSILDSPRICTHCFDRVWTFSTQIE